MRSVGTSMLVLVLAVWTTTARAEPLACQRSILKESTKVVRTRVKELRKCEDRKLKGALAAGTDCATHPSTAAKIAKAESRLRIKLARTCGGPDRICGTADDELLVDVGWPAACPDFQGAGCTNAIAGCDDIADCLVCVGGAAAEQTIATVYAAEPAPDESRLGCQRAIGDATRKMAEARANALRKCWDARLKGSHANTCPDPGDGKAAAKIAKAESRARAGICKACGGPDRACGGGDDLAPSSIGFPPVCPSPAPCVTTVGTLDGLVACATCVAALDIDCTSALGTPALASYPPHCPSAGILRLELDGTAAPVDLDLGWTGFAHDLAAPWLGRLTLAMSCAGDGQPTYGECALSGPLPNDGGAAFASQRCADRTWLACADDLACLAQGAAGPCRFFLGPPQPTGVSGVTSCTLNAITGPVSGTLDAEAGALTMSMPVTTSVSLDDFASHPCPRCVGGTCDAGPRAGMPCVVQGISNVFGDAVSLDCPPAAPSIATLATIVPLATESQLATVTGASPACSGSGAGSLRCLCDTCATAAAEPCGTDADCPGAVAGSCGGLRCLGGPAHGTPCTTAGLADPACSGAPCGFVGEPTRPNACFGSCTPTAGGEGQCDANGPYEGFCGPSEPFRLCTLDSDCPVPGDSCAYAPRPCFPGDGTIGTSVTATGIADPPVGGSFAPTLAGLFCVPSAASSLVNAARGLPGLGRVATTVTASIVEP